MWARFCSYGRANPLSTALVTSTIKTTAADALTQIYLEDCKTLDYQRLGLFTGFGFMYLGAFQYLLYVKLFAKWFPHAAKFGDLPTTAARLCDRQGMIDLAKQTFVGNFLHIPFCFFPAFYLTKEVIEKREQASPLRAIEQYRTNAANDLITAWQIWIPGHMLFFSVPLWARLPTNHAMSFGFVCVLSGMRGSQ